MNGRRSRSGAPDEKQAGVAIHAPAYFLMQPIPKDASDCERLQWLQTHQPNNWEAIAAVKRRLSAGHLTADAPLVVKAQPTAQPGDFYERLKALHSKVGGTVYSCCVKLGLKQNRNPLHPMDEAERMVCRLTNEGRIAWTREGEPVFQ